MRCKIEHIAKELREDFQRWVELIGEDPYAGRRTVGIIDTLKAHYLIVDYFSTEFGEGIGGIGPRDINLLHSALNRQMTSFGGKDKWNSDFDVCATLFFGLIKNHPFHDVNKRTAFLSLLFHLRKINRTPNTKQKDFETLALRIASNELWRYKTFNRFKEIRDGNIYFISDFLRKNTRIINNNDYIITYRDLDNILHRKSYGLLNPDKNNIDIVRFEKETIGLFKKQTRIIEKRIGSISFPGWKKQICSTDIKRVRKLTGLTSENGYDSDTFFHNAEPLSALISQYQGPLLRLADK